MSIDLDGLEGTVIIGGVSHIAVGPGSGLLSGIGNAIGSAASSISSFVFSIGRNAARIGTEVYNQGVESRNIRIQTGERIIEDVFREIKPTIGVGARVGGTILAVLWPSDAIKGGDLRPDQYRLKYRPDFQTNPENDEDNDKKYLVRFGAEPESAEKLAEDASRAEIYPRFGHGVSTTLRNRISSSDKKHRSALLVDVAKYFIINPSPTANNPYHVTVILPKPVTQEVANRFNSVFKTRK